MISPPDFDARTPTLGSRNMPILIEEDDNPFLRSYLEHGRRAGVQLPRPSIEIPPLVFPVAKPPGSDYGDLNVTGKILLPR